MSSSSSVSRSPSSGARVSACFTRKGSSCRRTSAAWNTSRSTPPEPGVGSWHASSWRRVSPSIPFGLCERARGCARRPPSMPPPLQGLRALDLTDPLGYLCGRLLVDLGVEVIKVEPPGGDEDRPPTRVTLWQAFCHAGAEAGVGTLLAHLARGRSGRGQHVVVNAQAAMVWTLMNAQAFPIFHGDSPRRNGVFVGSRGVRRRMIFACADGFVSLLLLGKQGAPPTLALMRWMEECGMLPGWLREWPWAEWEPGWAMEMSPEVQAEMVRIEEVVEAFL